MINGKIDNKIENFFANHDGSNPQFVLKSVNDALKFV